MEIKDNILNIAKNRSVGVKMVETNVLDEVKNDKYFFFEIW